jgi:hypothetical protein
MRDFLILFVHLIVTAARLARPGGLRSVVAESVLVRHQLLVLNRGRKRAPKLRTPDRIIAGFVYPFHAPGTPSPFRHRSEACHSAALPQCAEDKKIPHVVFAAARASPWPEGTEERPHRRRRCNETS